MKIRAAVTYKQLRQGSGLDNNATVVTATVADIRLTPDIVIPPGSLNREAFTHMPSGDISLNGVKPEHVETFSVGDIIEIEFTKP